MLRASSEREDLEQHGFVRVRAPSVSTSARTFMGTVKAGLWLKRHCWEKVFKTT